MKLKIVHDDTPCWNPREVDELCLMACWHRRYILGDIQPKEHPTEWVKQFDRDDSLLLGLYLYDHSGITIKIGEFGRGDRWDSGPVGYIVMSGANIEKHFEGNDEKAMKYMHAVVKEYDFYLRGECWGWEVVDECECCGHETDVVESAYGFIGDTLEYTGIGDDLPDEVRDQIESAWEARYG